MAPETFRWFVWAVQPVPWTRISGWGKHPWVNTRWSIVLPVGNVMQFGLLNYTKVFVMHNLKL
jgi:hypothetical protein